MSQEIVKKNNTFFLINKTRNAHTHTLNLLFTENCSKQQLASNQLIKIYYIYIHCSKLYGKKKK